MCDCKDKQPAPERKPHVHADVIKAWADGHQVEVFLGGSWQLARSPSFGEDQHYRVKPEPKPQTDVEKYGVEVGDVWITPVGIKTVAYFTRGDVYKSVKLLDVVGNCGETAANFSKLLFRRGVVNKL